MNFYFPQQFVFNKTIYISASSVKGIKDSHILPRQFWKNKSKQKRNLCGPTVKFSAFL